MIIKPSDLTDSLLAIKKTLNGRRGVPTGFDCLDDYLYLSKQYLLVLTGMPSCGKSEFLDAVAVNTAIMYDWRWLYFSPENFPLEAHLKKIVEKKVGKGIGTIADSVIRKEVAWAQEHFSWVHPPDDRGTLDDILTEVEQVIQMGNQVDAVVLDPWNELDHSPQGHLRDDQYISQSLSKLRKFHRKYDIMTVIVIHPTKPQKDTAGNYPVPTLYDCHGGAMWRNKADMGICVHRHNLEAHQADVYVQKVKFKDMGKIGKVTFDYDYISGRFKSQRETEFTLPCSPDQPF